MGSFIGALAIVALVLIIALYVWAGDVKPSACTPERAVVGLCK